MALWWGVNMPDKLLLIKDTGACELATLKPYPAVASGTNTTVSTSTDATGKVTYTVNATQGTDSYVTGITIDNSTGVVTLTRNNGLPNLTANIVPNPVVVAGSNVTVTPTTGANGVITYTVAASGGATPVDSYVTGITISPAGLVTLTRNNGLPNLTAQIQYPAVTTLPVPGIGARMGSAVITTQGQFAVFDTFVNPMGGFNGSVGDTSFNVPETGWYYISHRGTARKKVATNPACMIRVVLNGSPLQTLGINFGVNYFPYVSVNEQVEVEKSMLHLLTAGDVIAVEAFALGAGAQWDGETFNVLWHSAP